MKNNALIPSCIMPVLAAFSVACAAPDIPSRVAVAHLRIGDADTITVHNRKPVQLPVRTFDGSGDEVSAPSVAFAWMSGDSIPVSTSGTVQCTGRGIAVVGASTGSVNGQVVVRCLPVRSVHMAGPLDLLLSDSSHQLQAVAIGPDGQRVRAVQGTTEIRSRYPPVIAIDAGTVIPLAAGAGSVTFRVGDETASITVHVYEGVPTLERLSPEQNHVAVPIRLRRGQARRLPLPIGVWLIAMQPSTDLPDDMRVDVERVNCETVRWPKGRLLCLATPGGVISISHDASSDQAELRTTLLLRRTNTGSALAYCDSLRPEDPDTANACRQIIERARATSRAARGVA
jgi:hypothetical protein